jgi:hypothetical protein
MGLTRANRVLYHPTNSDLAKISPWCRKTSLAWWMDVNGLTIQKWRLNFRSKIPCMCFCEEMEFWLHPKFGCIPFKHRMGVRRNGVYHNLGQVYCWTWLLKGILSMLIKGKKWSFFFLIFQSTPRICWVILDAHWEGLWAVYCKPGFLTTNFIQLQDHSSNWSVIPASDFYNSHFETDVTHESACIFCSWSM